MNELTRNGDKRMTTKEVAESLGVSEQAIRKHALEMGLTKNGVQTWLDEKAVTEIKLKIEYGGQIDLQARLQLPKTLLEKQLIIRQAAQLQDEIIAKLQIELEQEKTGRVEAERKNSVLMHVKKVYTASEIAKECGLRSAQELNEKLEGIGIQYKQNGTWLPKADYADLGYFQIKQEVLESGKVIYDRKITQDGRSFILSLFFEKIHESN